MTSSSLLSWHSNHPCNHLPPLCSGAAAGPPLLGDGHPRQGETAGRGKPPKAAPGKPLLSATAASAGEALLQPDPQVSSSLQTPKQSSRNPCASSAKVLSQQTGRGHGAGDAARLLVLTELLADLAFICLHLSVEKKQTLGSLPRHHVSHMGIASSGPRRAANPHLAGASRHLEPLRHGKHPWHTLGVSSKQSTTKISKWHGKIFGSFLGE